LIEKRVVEQRLKAEPANSNDPDRLVVKQLNTELKELAICAVDHPLRKNVEYTDDMGRLGIKKIILKEGEFFVRVTLQEKTQYIRVEEIVADIKITETTFTISQ
jgi:hypothetical protein